jgi:hypothetical protein
MHQLEPQLEGNNSVLEEKTDLIEKPIFLEQSLLDLP